MEDIIIKEEGEDDSYEGFENDERVIFNKSVEENCEETVKKANETALEYMRSVFDEYDR